MEDRLLRLLDSEQISSSKFADIIGVQRSSVSHILSGRNKPSYDFLQKTLKAFPMLSADWLILGKGKMYEGDIEVGGGTLFDQPLRKTAAVSEIHQDIDSDGPGLSVSEEDIPSNSVTGIGKDVSGEVIEDAVPKTQGITGRKIKRLIILFNDNSFESYDPA